MAETELPHISVAVHVLITVLVFPQLVVSLSEPDIVTKPQESVPVAASNSAATFLNLRVWIK